MRSGQGWEEASGDKPLRHLGRGTQKLRGEPQVPGRSESSGETLWERVSRVQEGRQVAMSVTLRCTVPCFSLCEHGGVCPLLSPHSTLSSQDWGRKQGREGCTGIKPLLADLAESGPRPTVCQMMQL